MALPVLWHFRFSHFNEKVRWALDWKGIPHERRAVAPGPHVPVMFECSGQRGVPVLQLGEQVIADSTAIVAALEAAYPTPSLLPVDPTARARALALEDRFDEELGPHVRRLAFHALLPDSAYCIELFSGGVEPDPRKFYAKSFEMLREVMRAEMDVDDSHAAESTTAVTGLLDLIDRERGGRAYLVGDEFTIADLTAAALLAPLLQPAEFPYPPPAPAPGAMTALTTRYAAHPTMHWARDLYRRHRGHSAEA